MSYSTNFAGFFSAWLVESFHSERQRNQLPPKVKEMTSHSWEHVLLWLSVCEKTCQQGKVERSGCQGEETLFPSSLLLIGWVPVWGKGILPIGNNQCFVAGAKSFHKADIYWQRVCPVGLKQIQLIVNSDSHISWSAFLEGNLQKSVKLWDYSNSFLTERHLFTCHQYLIFAEFAPFW